MKKIWVIMLALLCLTITSPVLAGGWGCETPSCVTCPAIIDTDTDTQRQRFGSGVGAEVVLFKSGYPLIDEIRADVDYDIERRETTVMGRVRVDLFEYLANRAS